MLSFIDFVAYTLNEHHDLDQQQQQFLQKLLQFNTKVQSDPMTNNIDLIK